MLEDGFNDRMFGERNRWQYWLTIGAIVVSLISIACSDRASIDVPANRDRDTTDNVLSIWWEQGLNLDEDEAIRRIVEDWQQQTGNRVELSFFANTNLIPKTERALQAGNPPDILMTPKAERIFYPRLAWQGKLADVTEVIEPIAEQYSRHILRGVTYYNAKKNRYSYYGVPIYQATMSIFYWQSLLNKIGLTSEDIPQDWEGFWQFWQQAQIELNQQDKNVYGLGLSLSGNESADDTHYLFEQILEAYNLVLLDDRGKLNIDATVRQGIIDRLSWYARTYRQGYIPPNAVKWSNTDNNLNLLNQSILMTPNVSLSIPATVRQDADTYYNQLGITEFPDKPNGEPMRYLIFIRQAVIFADSSHKSQAKEFLRYFIRPEITIKYLKATGSRNQPVQNSAWQNPYWQNTTDPYLALVTKILTTDNIRLSYIVENPAYSQVLAENIWGQALTRVTAEGIEPEQAADIAISRIKAIFAEWEKQNN